MTQPDTYGRRRGRLATASKKIPPPPPGEVVITEGQKEALKKRGRCWKCGRHISKGIFQHTRHCKGKGLRIDDYV